MDLTMLKEKHPEVFQAAIAEGATVAVATERERIAAINALPAKGHTAIVQAAIDDGKSTAADVALAIIKKEEAIRTGKLADMIADSPAAVSSMEGTEMTAEQTEVSATVSAMVQYAKEQGRA